jgi:hypothetical protein
MVVSLLPEAEAEAAAMASADKGGRGRTMPWAMTDTAMRPLRAYMVESYRCGVGSMVPGGASTISLPMESDLAASSSDQDSMGALKAAWNFSGEIFAHQRVFDSVRFG